MPVRLLLGEGYEGSVPVLRLLALAAIPSIVSQLCMVGLQSLGHDRGVARMIPAAVLLHLALVCVLAGPYGAIGAAIAFAIMQYSLMVVLVTYAVWMRRRSREQALAAPGSGTAERSKV